MICARCESEAVALEADFDSRTIAPVCARDVQHKKLDTGRIRLFSVPFGDIIAWDDRRGKFVKSFSEPFYRAIRAQYEAETRGMVFVR